MTFSDSIPLALRISLRLEKAWDLLEPESDPENGPLPESVYADLAQARCLVESALRALKEPLDHIPEADRIAAGEVLSESNRDSQPGQDYDY